MADLPRIRFVEECDACISFCTFRYVSVWSGFFYIFLVLFREHYATYVPKDLFLGFLSRLGEYEGSITLALGQGVGLVCFG